MESLVKSQLRDQRRMDLKLDCVDAIVYKNWEPGHYYSKTFLVKNISTKVQMLRWEPSVSPYFEVIFQEPHARLNPMMVAAITIAFRPAALENYESVVVFRTSRGQFNLELRGPLPIIDLGIPDFIDFQYGPVNDMVEKTFVMKNASEITVTYEWTVEPPFSIHPTQSSIQMGKSETIFCRFQPARASAFSTKAICCTYLGVAAELKMKGIGKYSFLNIASPLIAFGEIIVRTKKELSLVVTNISIVPAKFHVVKLENKLCKSDANVFSVLPIKGVIQPSKSFTFKVTFNPATAGCYYVENFAINTCGTCRAEFACTGKAARPVVKLSTFSLDFGSVEPGGVAARSVLVDNQSVVPVHVQFMANDMGVFHFLSERAICRPNRAAVVTIHFQPQVIANYYKRVVCVVQDQHALYCDLLGTCYLHLLKSPTLMQYHVDQHRELLKTACAEVAAAVHEPEVHFPSRQSVLANIRPFFSSTSSSRNRPSKKSLTGAEWEPHPSEALRALMDVDEQSKAMVPPTKAPETEAGGMVRFQAGAAAHQLNKFAAPAAHIAGLYLNPTDSQVFQGPHHKDSRQLAEHLLHTQAAPTLDSPQEDTSTKVKRKARLDSRYVVFSKTWQRGMGDYKAVHHYEVWDEYFTGGIENWQPVDLDKQVVDFGLEKCLHLSDPQFLHVYNNLATPVTLLWVPPVLPRLVPFRGLQLKPSGASKSPSKSSAQELRPARGIFQVFPDKAVLPPQGSYTFSVIFEPRAQNNHYCQALQLFVWTPAIDRVVPPWSISVCATGHSFQKQTQEFLPDYSVSKTDINFAPVLKGLSVYETVILKNHNKTIPLSFIFQLKSLLAEFTVKPEQGLLPPGEFQLITFRYDAADLQKISHRLTCVLNHSSVNNLEFLLSGSSHFPKLVLEKNGIIRFKPTSVGAKATSYVVLFNASAIATEFEWQVPKQMLKFFSVAPITGLLHPGDSIRIAVSFLPQSPKSYYCNIPCRAFAHVEKAFIRDNGMEIESVCTREVNRIHLIANGQAMVDTVQIEPETLDYGVIVVGFPYRESIILRNLSSGDLQFDLKAIFTSQRQETSCKVVIDPSTGYLPGRGTLKICVSFHAMEEMDLEFYLICQVYLPIKDNSYLSTILSWDSSTCPPEAHNRPSTVRGKSATGLVKVQPKYPYMVICSVRSDGLSNLQMWRELQVRKLNNCLSRGRLFKQASGEAAHENLFCCGATINTTRLFTFDFGAKLVSTEAEQTVIDMVIKSGNELPLAWKVRLWNDNEVEMEHWVEPMPSTAEESKLLLIREHNLFYVEPNEGYILPGDEQFVRFRYLHVMEGLHVLPALIQVQYGRTVHIHLKGRTLPHVPKILVMDVEKHFLRPTPIGTLNPEYQTVELCNRGTCDIEYEVDIKPLEEMMKLNFGFRVFWCQNPTGIIPFQDSVLLNWMFQPLEAKHYDVKVDVHITGGEGRTLTIEGHGIKPNSKAELLQNLAPKHQPPNMGQTYNWPDLPIILSTELVDFQEVPELSQSFRLLAIQSLSLDSVIHFEWFTSTANEKNLKGKLQVLPKRGVIQPNKQTLCKVKFDAGVQPQIFETTFFLIAKRVPVEHVELLHIPEKESTLQRVEVFVDTWPKCLGTDTFFDKSIKHDSVIERYTTTAKYHMTDNARYKLERLEEEREFKRSEQLQREYLGDSHMPPICSTLYLTIRGHVCASRYDPTNEDLLSIEERLGLQVTERSETDVQLEVVFGIMLELLQESLQYEMSVPSFDTFEKMRGNRILYFEDLRKPAQPPEVAGAEEDRLDGLPAGALPECPTAANESRTPQTPCSTLTYLDSRTLSGDVGEGMLMETLKRKKTAIFDRIVKKSIDNKEKEEKGKKKMKEEKDEPPQRAVDISFEFLEEALFSVVKDFFEESS